MSIPVATVGDGPQDFVAGLERLHGPVTVVRRCTELAELVAACQSGLARAAIIASGSDALGLALLDRLRGAGAAVVVLTDDGGEQRRLDGLGVRHCSHGTAPEALAALVVQAVGSADEVPAAHRPGAGYADPAHSLQPLAAAPGSDRTDGEPADAAGEVIAVWGPAGAPGRTLLAVNLAAEYAAAGRRVLLVDADTYAPGVATYLGLLDESAALAHACRLADQGLLDTPALERAAVKVAVSGAPLLVLTGITRADRWPEIRPGALGAVLALARALADVTVIDCGFCLESDEELSFDTLAPRRNGATLRALELADQVLAVGSADALGVPRLVRALAELEQAVPSASPQAVLNRVRPGSVGRSPERQLREAWTRFAPDREVRAFLPADFAAADAALLGGSVLLETAPDSALRQAVARLAGIAEPARRRGPGRRPPAKVKF
ncbi:chromosome partitioning protein [Arthrobacter sp. I2-34]|uniref:Chromosome partitioning protein n=1 Tax=Arthrobacter hankyongi TaxID=2904801 RepID=A0ABS9L7R6_9MICC|nr:chromosome partitioning protein [Arthrobacter hankyongi]MCG2622725.1 chromosome partitioning protein [Arthrobacter hankyongi]